MKRRTGSAVPSCFCDLWSRREYRIARSRAGAWAETTRQCRAAREALGSDEPCEMVYHFYWLELELWDYILGNSVLPHRQEELLEAFREHAALHTPEDVRAWRAAFCWWIPGSSKTTSSTQTPLIRIELRFLS